MVAGVSPLEHPRSHAWAGVLLYGGFVVTAMITTLLGPMIPLLAMKWALSDAAVAYLFTAQFVGSKAGNLLLSAILIPRVGLRSAIVLGYALMCAGVGALGAGVGWPIVLVAVFCFGSGIGITTPATNLWVAEANPTCRVAKLNLLKLAWSLGAMALPIVLMFCHDLWGISEFLITLAAVSGFLAICTGYAREIESQTRSAGTPERELSGLHLPALFSVVAVFFLYVGVENSLAWWMSSLTQRLSTSHSHWMVATSFFWGGLLLGRATAPFVLRHLEESRLGVVGLASAAVATAAMIFVRSVPLLFASASLAGLGLATIYPIAIASVTRAFSLRTASAMFLFSGFSGVAMPWLVGKLSARTGSLSIGISVPLFAILAMLAFQLLVNRIPALTNDCAPASLALPRNLAESQS